MKSLYGLKQESKQWHEKFNETLLVDGFSSSDANRCMYTKFVNDGHVIISLYVDNILIFGTCNDIVFKTKYLLASKFDMKDMGEARVNFGVKIKRKGDSILLSYEHYVEKLLKKYKYYDFKSVSTPYDVNSQLKKNRGKLIAQTQCAQIIGSLLHLMNFSIPDIAYAVGKLSRYTHSPN